MKSDDRPFSAYLDQINVITILLPNTYHYGVSQHFFFIDEKKEKSPLNIAEIIPLGNVTKYICTSDVAPEIGSRTWVVDSHGEMTDLQIGSVIRTSQFDQQFFYDGNDLGVTYLADKVTFKVWAPTATSAKLKLLSPAGQRIGDFEMSRRKKGVWVLELNGNYEHYRYSYLVCINMKWQEAVDPYTVALTANGTHGVIVDLKKTRRQRLRLPPIKSPVDAIIYETHIRDFTIHPFSGVQQKGTYLGAAEQDTVGKDGNPTGLSYVKSLGVTHIELLPFNDFAGVDELSSKKDYNWGYNPLHFNAPEGSYSTNPNSPYARINELKAMIEAFHKEGIHVIMDVVYNHVYIREQSGFEKLVPGYYFRHGQHGMPSNGTGVGNDIASERLMVRKFIVDSVEFWMEEYHVDGFRFDLMGIIDIETMLEIRKIVDRINPSAIIIGEGWDLNTPIHPEHKANIRNQKKLPKIAQFNDWFRDSVKGSTFNLYDRGFALGNDHYYESVKQVLFGSIGIEKPSQGIFTEPTQSVNYVESHDNHTLWDKLDICKRDENMESKQRYHRLATAIVLLAQGIPFLHSGQEFFRTKNGNGNSYRSPDEINAINWELASRYRDNVDFIKGIIDIRKSHGAFRLPTANIIRQHMLVLPAPKPVLGFLLKKVGNYGNWEFIAVYFNPSVRRIEVEFPLSGVWYTLSDGGIASKLPIGKSEGTHTNLEPISASIFVKDE